MYKLEYSECGEDLNASFMMDSDEDIFGKVDLCSKCLVEKKNEIALLKEDNERLEKLVKEYEEKEEQ